MQITFQFCMCSGGWFGLGILPIRRKDEDQQEGSTRQRHVPCLVAERRHLLQRGDCLRAAFGKLETATKSS